MDETITEETTRRMGSTEETNRSFSLEALADLYK